MKPTSEIKNIQEFLDKLVDEYTENMIENYKMLIINEDLENFEECQKIKTKIDEINFNIALTISQLNNVDFDISYQRLLQSCQYFYKELKETK